MRKLVFGLVGALAGSALYVAGAALVAGRAFDARVAELHGGVSAVSGGFDLPLLLPVALAGLLVGVLLARRRRSKPDSTSLEA